MLFDTHLHLIYMNKLTYPWLESTPALRFDSTYKSYQSIAHRIGITGALHMEVDVAEPDIEAETDLIAELMNSESSLMKGAISACRPEATGFAEFLERQQLRSEIKGFRRVLHVASDDTSTSSLFRDNVKRLSSTGLTFDLCVFPTQIPLAIELVDHCPDVTFILDHCGVPDITANDFESWSRQIDNIARRDNVVAKISGVVAYGNLDTWTIDDISPYVEHTIQAFGWDRVIWGSDSPVCTLAGHLETWVAATHALLEGCSAHEKAALLYKNAMTLWSVENNTTTK